MKHCIYICYLIIFISCNIKEKPQVSKNITLENNTILDHIGFSGYTFNDGIKTPIRDPFSLSQNIYFNISDMSNTNVLQYLYSYLKQIEIGDSVCITMRKNTPKHLKQFDSILVHRLSPITDKKKYIQNTHENFRKKSNYFKNIKTYHRYFSFFYPKCFFLDKHILVLKGKYKTSSERTYTINWESYFYGILNFDTEQNVHINIKHQDQLLSPVKKALDNLDYTEDIILTFILENGISKNSPILDYLPKNIPIVYKIQGI